MPGFDGTKGLIEGLGDMPQYCEFEAANGGNLPIFQVEPPAACSSASITTPTVKSSGSANPSGAPGP